MPTTITTFKKSKLGVEDIHFDANGSDAVASTPTSKGGVRNVRKLNAAHLPITSATRAKKGADNVTITTTNVDTTLQHILDQLVQIGIPDGTILQFSSGTLQIATGSITNAKMADNSIDSAQYVDGSIDEAHIADAQVSASKLATDAVTSDKILNSAVTTAKINNDAVTNDKILDGTIKAVKLSDAPSHYIKACEEISSSTTGTSLTFTTATSLNSADIFLVTVKSFGTGPSYVKTVNYAGANSITVVVDASQTAGSTTIQLTILKAVVP